MTSCNWPGHIFWLYKHLIWHCYHGNRQKYCAVLNWFSAYSLSADIAGIWQPWTQHIHRSLIPCSQSVWLHDGPFLHVHAHKWVWHEFDSLHGYTGRAPDSGTIVMNSLLKSWSTALPLFCFFSPPPASCLLPLSSLSLSPFPYHFFPVWWIGFQLPSVNAISRRSCPILRHMCGDTDQRCNRHFQAMGLGCMQHKTSNGGLASDSYWCTVGLYVTEEADQHKHAHQCSVVMICTNGGTEKPNFTCLTLKFKHNFSF